MISNPELETIYLNLRPTILRWLRGTMSQTPEDSEDIYQEAMIKFRTHYRRGLKPLNLVVEIAKNMVYDRTRKAEVRARNQPDYEPIPDPQAVLERKQDLAMVRRIMLEGLKGHAYMVTRLYLDGYSPRDISELSGIPVRAVYRRLRRIV